ncbi:unnamed protein product [Chironomus riparius]|uniref:Uncharacterized protein n=1 Tax=Chironomus riparius TaxID=315576 RepID=A0A9N9RLK3_9DIPT|nr:unnamed protein product [Chironomus riparius]
MPESPIIESTQSLIPKANQTPKLTARKHWELSPTEEQTSPKKKCSSMSNVEKDLKLFMEEMRGQMTSMSQKMDEWNRHFDSKVDTMIADVNQVKKDLEDVRGEIINLEVDNVEIQKKIKNHDSQLNAINQMMLEKEITMVNIASTIKEEKFLEDMNKWSNNIIKETLMSHNFSSNAKYKSKSAHLHFNTMNDKKKFLNFLKTKQRDVNKKYIPILNENIFTLQDSDVNRANAIEFRTPMTSINRELFNKARNAKKKNPSIEGVWISNGTMRIRIKDKKPVQINDIEQLTDLFSSNNIQFPME